MSAPDAQSRLMGLGVFLLPLMLVKVTAMMLGQPPQGAIATGGHTPPIQGGVIETYTPVWSLEQVAAAHRVAELRDLPFGESPLLHAREQTDVGPIIPVKPPDQIKPPDVQVQMILRSRRGNVALINRNRYREGDSIGEDGKWLVKEIDADTRSVLIVHPESGMEATLSVPMPR